MQRDAMKHGGLSRLSGGLVRLQQAQAGAAKQRSLSVVRAGRNPLMKVVDGFDRYRCDRKAWSGTGTAHWARESRPAGTQHCVRRRRVEAVCP